MRLALNPRHRATRSALSLKEVCKRSSLEGISRQGKIIFRRVKKIKDKLAFFFFFSFCSNRTGEKEEEEENWKGKVLEQRFIYRDWLKKFE